MREIWLLLPAVQWLPQGKALGQDFVLRAELAAFYFFFFKESNFFFLAMLQGLWDLSHLSRN